jgi:diguanylate cyclase (GGDEF)-like protein
VSFYSVWFIWVGLYSFYFFGRRGAAAHVSIAATLYAVTLISQPADSSVARWLTTVATLVVAGGFIDTLVRRSRRQAEVAAATADNLQRFAAASHDLAGISDPVEARSALCKAAVAVAGARHVALWEPGAGETARLEISAEAGAARATPEPVATATRMILPIAREGGPGALLAIDWSSAAKAREPGAASLGSLLAAEALITLNRLELLGRLGAMARTDDLTGLPNRRAWEEQAPREIERARREQIPLCVALIDLDHFKHYNDAQGHQAGDRLLKQAAAAWQHELRTTDTLARYGGEEFALLLAGCDADQALATLERVREATPEGQECSAGLAIWDGAESSFELFGRADAALYEAKRAGRGRCVWAAAPA